MKTQKPSTTQLLASLFIISTLMNQVSFKIVMSDTSNLISELTLIEDFDKEIKPYDISQENVICEMDKQEKAVDGQYLCNYKFNLKVEEDHYLVSKTTNNSNLNEHDVQPGDHVLILKRDHNLPLGTVTDKKCIPDREEGSEEIGVDDFLEHNDFTEDDLREVGFVYMSPFAETKFQIYDFDRAFFSHRRVANTMNYEFHVTPEFFSETAPTSDENHPLPEFKEIAHKYLENLHSIVIGDLDSKVAELLIDLKNEKDGNDGEESNFSFMGFGTDSSQVKFMKQYEAKVKKIMKDTGDLVLQNTLMMGTLRFYYENIALKQMHVGNVGKAINTEVKTAKINLVLETLWDMFDNGLYLKKKIKFGSLQSHPHGEPEEYFSVTHRMKNKFVEKINKLIIDELEHNQEMSIIDEESGMERNVKTEMKLFEAHLYHLAESVFDELEELLKDDKSAIQHWKEEIFIFLVDKCDFNEFLTEQLIDRMKGINTFIDEYWKITKERTFVPDLYVNFDDHGDVNMNKLVWSMSYFKNTSLIEPHTVVPIMQIELDVKADQSSEVNSDSHEVNSDSNKVIDEEIDHERVDDVSGNTSSEVNRSNSNHSENTSRSNNSVKDLNKIQKPTSERSQSEVAHESNSHHSVTKHENTPVHQSNNSSNDSPSVHTGKQIKQKEDSKSQLNHSQHSQTSNEQIKKKAKDDDSDSTTIEEHQNISQHNGKDYESGQSSHQSSTSKNQIKPSKNQIDKDDDSKSSNHDISDHSKSEKGKKAVKNSQVSVHESNVKDPKKKTKFVADESSMSSMSSSTVLKSENSSEIAKKLKKTNQNKLRERILRRERKIMRRMIVV